MDRDNLLIVADSERDANMLYATGLFAPDPFIYLRLKGKSHLVMSDMEIDRARKASPQARVISLSQCQEKLLKKKSKSIGFASIIQLLLREHRIKKIYVPASFPYGLAKELRGMKTKVKVREGWFFPERQCKTPLEVKKISAALLMAEVGLAEAMQTLRNSKISKDGRILYHNCPLTSEKLRGVIETAVLQAGGTALRTIVAGGRQACDPHEPGHGVLRAREPIIIDVFPRSQKTGYYGDISRTVIKGRASEVQRRMYDTVQRSQELAFKKVRHGVSASEIHETVQNFFESTGFQTGARQGRMTGFFHGLGHGLGLEIHESPRVNMSSQEVLQAGHVFTLEPGLYYPELGGVRLEDVVYLNHKCAHNLTRFEKTLEIL